MNHLRSWLLQAIRGIRSGWLIQLASIGAITVGLLLVGLSILTIFNMDRLSQRWGRSIQAIAYLQGDAQPARVDALITLLNKRPEVIAVHHVHPEEAYGRLAESLGHRMALLAGVDQDFLPASLEISLRRDHEPQIRPLMALLSSSPMIEEVDYLGAWVKRLNSLVVLLRTGGSFIILIVGLACLYIIGSTIKLGVFARREEIEILKLVGATDRFIRAPFLIEGLLQGLVGAAAACGLLYFIFHSVAPEVEGMLSTAIAHMRLVFLPWTAVLAVIGAGAILGLMGSRIALSRYTDV